MSPRIEVRDCVSREADHLSTLPAVGGRCVGEENDIVPVYFAAAAAVAEEVWRSGFGCSDAIAFVRSRWEIAWACQRYVF